MTDALNNNFNLLGLDVTWYSTAGDGNCLYGSISNELMGNDKYKRVIRFLTIKFAQDNYNYYNNFFSQVSNDYLVSYINKQFKDGEEGEARSLEFACVVFNVNIYCWTWDHSAKEARLFAYLPKDFTEREIHLVHCGVIGGSQHYYSIRFGNNYEANTAKMIFKPFEQQFETPPNANILSFYSIHITPYAGKKIF